jgi:exosortase E/protease (VPEID-CTERM system)
LSSPAALAFFSKSVFVCHFLPGRAAPHIGAAVLLVSLELIALSLAIDTENLRAGPGFARIVASIAPRLSRAATLAFVLACAFAAATGRPGWFAALGARTRWRISAPAALAHLGFGLATTLASLQLFSGSAAGPAADWLAALSVAAAIAAFVFGSAIFVPASFWTGFVRSAPLAPLAGLAAAGASIGIAEWTAFTGPWMRLTFSVIATLLRVVRPDGFVDPANSIIRVGSFEVTMAPECSGFEGVAMMLVFGAAWLLMFRGEFRFPHAMLLIPVGMAAIWTLNCLRIIVLLLIGAAGGEAVALGGFHSQAGWIAFVTMAVAFCLAGQRVAWIARVPQAPAVAVKSATDDRTPAYLLPFLAILAAGMLARAASGGFEWVYPLRVVAAVAVLWRFRRVYADLKWTAGPVGVAIGAAVFALWIVAERLLGPGTPPTGAPAAWTAAPDAARWTWLLFRVLGGVVTVPIAEELAFRGYALRRLQSPDFAAVDLRTFAWMPFLVSSVLFGSLHGSRWFVGAVAGMLFAWAAKRRGSIGDAVVAHAVANLLLAAWVLATGDWRLW